MADSNKGAKSTSRLSSKAAEKLIGAMRAKTGQRPRSISAQPTEKAQTYDERFTDFAKHPEYEQIQMQTMFADHTKLESPYFRLHDAHAGATSHIDGDDVVNFGSYDYIGLNQVPAVGEAAKAAIATYGTSVSASRVVAGERPFHREFERKIAAVYEADDAIAYVSGHATNVSTIAALLGSKDLVLYDAWAHNSIVMGAKLSGATMRNFTHNDADALEMILKGCRHQYERVLIIVEGLYSMDGDMPNLKRFIDVKKRYQAWLMVDEAHGLGVLGKTGRGVAEEQNIPYGDVDVWMGTLSKTLSSCGGYVAGCQALIEILKYKSPGFVFSVGLPPSATAAASKALDVMLAEPERVEKLRNIGKYTLKIAKEAGIDTGVSEGFAVIPIMVRDAIKAVVLADKMLNAGYNMLPIIYPAVPMKEARLRLFMTSEHTKAQVEGAVEALAREMTDLKILTGRRNTA